MSFNRPHRLLALLTLLCVFFTLTLIAGAQDTQPARKINVKKVDFALYAADTTLRSLDVVSTHALLSSPCKCFYEVDPLAPGSPNLMPHVAFQYGMAAAIIVGHRMLVRHHRPRLARILLVADIVSETWAVQNNFRQREPLSQPAAFAAAP